MKKINLFISGIFIALGLSGCVPKIDLPTSLNQASFNDVEEKFEDLDKLNCNFNNKKVYINFTTTQKGAYSEYFDTLSKEKIEIQYEGDFGIDLTKFVSNLFGKYCNANIVLDENIADFIVKGNVDKYFIQNEKINGTINKTKVDAEEQTTSTLAIDYNINTNKYLYINKIKHLSKNKGDILDELNSKVELYSNDYSIPFTIILLSKKSNYFEALLKKYDKNGKEIKKLTVSLDDVKNNTNNMKIIQLHQNIGLLKLSIYSYFEKLVEEINDQTK